MTQQNKTPLRVTKSPFPEDSAVRKQYPVFTGAILYFPDAIAEVSHHSQRSFEKHNPGGQLGWVPEESIGDGNEITRHIIEAVAAYNAGNYVLAVKEAAAVAWRGLEFAQRMIKGMPPFERK